MSIVAFLSILAALFVVIALGQPLARRMKLSYAVLLALLGIAQERAGHWYEAEDNLRAALARGANDAMAFIALGRVYRNRGDREGAVEMFQRAREIGAAGPDSRTAPALTSRGAMM